MIISTRTRYGFRLLVYLASNDTGSNIQLSEIASEEDISVKYLEKIVQYLKRAGFVRVTRGAKGGYRLARPAGQINLREVFTVLEGSNGVLDFDESTLDIWEGLSEVIAQYLEKQSLEDLASKDVQHMYYI